VNGAPPAAAMTTTTLREQTVVTQTTQTTIEHTTSSVTTPARAPPTAPRALRDGVSSADGGVRALKREREPSGGVDGAPARRPSAPGAPGHVQRHTSEEEGQIHEEPERSDSRLGSAHGRWRQ
jgi:hypothetical protein